MPNSNKRKSSEHRSSLKKLKISISNLSDEEIKDVKELLSKYNNNKLSIKEIPNYDEPMEVDNEDKSNTPSDNNQDIALITDSIKQLNLLEETRKGKLYELWLFMLLLIQKNNNYDIGKEVKLGHKFDDLVIRDNESGKQRDTFIQVKHVDDAHEKRITQGVLLGDQKEKISTSPKDFDLKKYFLSYLRIQDQLGQKKVSELEKLIIITNVCDVQCSDDQGLKKEQITQELRSMSFFNMGSSLYQLKVEQGNKIFQELSKTPSDIDNLVGEFTKCINDKNTMTLDADYMQYYHNALLKVIKIENSKGSYYGKFQDTFLQGKNLSAGAKKLYNKLTTNNCIKGGITTKTAWKMSSNFISQKAEDDIVLPTYEQVSNEDVENFFKHLVLSVNNPSIDNNCIIEKINREQIKVFFAKYFAADPLYIEYLIKKFLNKQSKNWITYKEKELFITALELSISKPEAYHKTGQYKHKIENLVKNYGLQFTEESINDLTNHFKTTNQILCINTDSTLLTSIKMMSYLDRTLNNNYFFINYEILSDKKELEALAEAFYAPELNFFILEYKSISQDTLNLLIKKLLSISGNNTQKKVIFITSQYIENHDNITCIEDKKINFVDLEDGSKILKQNIRFQGKMISLEKLIHQEEDKKIITPQVLDALINNEEIFIGDKLKNLDEIKDYYIDRSFYVPTINQDEIKNQESDYFIISGNNSTIVSGDKVFVYSNHDLVRNKFQDLCTQNQASNIHWCKMDAQGNLILHQSHNEITRIMQCTQESILLSQSEFINKGQLGKILLISDLAGSGKSTVLTQLATIIKESDNSTLIIRIDLNDYTQELTKLTEKQVNKTNVISFLYNAFKAKNKQPTFISDLEENLFNHSLEHENKIQLLLDGFDEPIPKYDTVLKQLLQICTKDLQLERLIITTRPHMRATLQKILKVLPCHLKVFSENEQIDFLTKFWQKKINIPQQEQVQSYAKNIIETFSSMINDEKNSFTAIPLHISMIAVIFQKSKENTTNPKQIAEFSLIDLYEYFFKKIFNDYCWQQKQKIDLQKSSVHYIFNDWYKDFLKKYTNIALYTLLDNVNQIIPQEELIEVDDFIEKPGNIIENFGIIDQIIDKKPHFVHRTFAEYLVACFLTKDLLKKPEIVTFLFKDIFNSKEYTTICSFIDATLAKEFGNSNQEAYVRAITNYYDKRYFNNIDDTLESQINGGNKNIAKLLLMSALKSKSNIFTKEGISNKVILHNAVIQESSELVSYILSYNKLKGEDIHNNKDNKNNTALHYAARSGNVPVLCSLLHHDVQDTYNTRGYKALHEAVEYQNLKAVRVLINKGFDINMDSNDNKTALHIALDRKNIDMIKLLVTNGAKVNMCDSDGATILHYAAIYGCSKIIQYLLENTNIDTEIRQKCDSKTAKEIALEKNMDKAIWEVTRNFNDYQNLLEGQAHCDKKQYDKAIKAYDKVEASSQFYDIAQIRKGNIYLYKKQYDEAIKAYDEVKTSSQFYDTAQIRKGNIFYFNKKQYDEAIKAYDEVKTSSQFYDEAQINKGHIYFNKKQYDEAIKAYDEVKTSSQFYDEAQINKGHIYFDKKQYDEAIKAYDEVKTSSQFYDEAQINKGNIYFNKKQYDEAIKAYDEVKTSSQSHDEAQINKGNIYFNKKQYDEAIKAYDEVKTSSQSHDEAQTAKVNSYKLMISDYNSADKNDINYIKIGCIYSKFVKYFQDVIATYRKLNNGYDTETQMVTACKHLKKVDDLKTTIDSTYQNVQNISQVNNTEIKLIQDTKKFLNQKYDYLIQKGIKCQEVTEDSYTKQIPIYEMYIYMKQIECFEQVIKCYDQVEKKSPYYNEAQLKKGHIYLKKFQCLNKIIKTDDSSLKRKQTQYLKNAKEIYDKIKPKYATHVNVENGTIKDKCDDWPFFRKFYDDVEINVPVSIIGEHEEL